MPFCIDVEWYVTHDKHFVKLIYTNMSYEHVLF